MKTTPCLLPRTSWHDGPRRWLASSWTRGSPWTLEIRIRCRDTREIRWDTTQVDWDQIFGIYCLQLGLFLTETAQNYATSDIEYNCVRIVDKQVISTLWLCTDSLKQRRTEKGETPPLFWAPLLQAYLLPITKEFDTRREEMSAGLTVDNFRPYTTPSNVEPCEKVTPYVSNMT